MSATKPIPGEQVIDASNVKLTDITPEEIVRLTKVRDGFEKAVANVVNLKQDDVERAGLNEKDIARLVLAFADDTRIGELLPSSAKLTELLYETQQLRRHDIGTILAELAAQARRRADRSANAAQVLGPLGELLDYQYGPGAKAAATKEKSKDAKAAAAPPAVPTP
jgi:hypothetical protein